MADWEYVNDPISRLGGLFPGAVIQSGRRTEEGNAALPGSAQNSHHLTGNAVDITPGTSGMSYVQMARIAKQNGYIPLPEGDHLHLYVPEGNVPYIGSVGSQGKGQDKVSLGWQYVDPAQPKTPDIDHNQDILPIPAPGSGVTPDLNAPASGLPQAAWENAVGQKVGLDDDTRKSIYQTFGVSEPDPKVGVTSVRQGAAKALVDAAQIGAVPLDFVHGMINSGEAGLVQYLGNTLGLKGSNTEEIAKAVNEVSDIGGLFASGVHPSARFNPNVLHPQITDEPEIVAEGMTPGEKTDFTAANENTAGVGIHSDQPGVTARDVTQERMQQRANPQANDNQTPDYLSIVGERSTPKDFIAGQAHSQDKWPGMQSAVIDPEGKIHLLPDGHEDFFSTITNGEASKYVHLTKFQDQLGLAYNDLTPLQQKTINELKSRGARSGLELNEQTPKPDDTPGSPNYISMEEPPEMKSTESTPEETAAANDWGMEDILNHMQGEGQAAEEAAAEQPSAADKLLQALKSTQAVRGNQDALLSAQRSQRIAAALAASKDLYGKDAYVAKLSALKGSMDKIDYQSIANQFSEDDIHELFHQINTSKLLPYDQVSAANGLAKMLGENGGTVPTTSELNKLQQVFGSDLVKEIMDKRPFMNTLSDHVASAMNLPRALMASFDLSAPLRQGIFLVGRKEFYPNFFKMIRMFPDEKFYNASMDSIKADPDFDIVNQSGVDLTGVHEGLLAGHEEPFMTSLAQKIPGIKASERAYTGFLTKLRFDVTKTLINKAQEAGIDFDQNPEVLSNIGNFVNNATGRGTYGKGKLGNILENSTPLLNAAFFSPKLIMSRVNLLNPVYYATLDPFTRMQAVKSLLAFGSIGLTVVGLAKMAGAKTTADPRSSDFGKIKIGNTKLDIWGGFQQYVRFGAQLLTNSRTSTNTGKNTELGQGYNQDSRLDVISKFGRGKLAPVPGFVADYFNGPGNGVFKDVNGNLRTLYGQGGEGFVNSELGTHFLPLFLQDVYDAQTTPGGAGAAAALPGAFGVGVQSYDNNQQKRQNQMILRNSKHKTSGGWEYVQ